MFSRICFKEPNVMAKVRSLLLMVCNRIILDNIYVDIYIKIQQINREKLPQSTPKAEQTEGNIVFGTKCVFLLEFLKCNETLNTHLYVHRLQRVQKKILVEKRRVIAKRKMLFFLMATQGCVYSKGNTGNISKLGGSFLLHPPYLPDFVPTHYYPF